MAKLTEFQNPLSGSKGNLFDIGNLWSSILGVFVLIFVFAMGEKLAKTVSGKIPAINTTVYNPLTPVPNTPAQKRVI